MATDTNPYESPISEGDTLDDVAAELRRTGTEIFFLVLWFLEGGLKAWLVGLILLSGFDLCAALVEHYQESNTWWFLFSTWFMIIETIGPWFGIYYLTAQRSPTLPLERAFGRTLMVAGGFSIVVTLLLMLYCQLIAAW